VDADTEVVDKEREFQARIDVGGVEPKNIRLVALPDSILPASEPKSNEARLFSGLCSPRRSMWRR